MGHCVNDMFTVKFWATVSIMCAIFLVTVQ
jgi:hypothetical protein